MRDNGRCDIPTPCCPGLCVTLFPNENVEPYSHRGLENTERDALKHYSRCAAKLTKTYVYSEVIDQSAHPRSLIRTFVDDSTGGQR